MEGEEVKRCETSFTIELMELHEESMWIPLIYYVAKDFNVHVNSITVKYDYNEGKYTISIDYEGTQSSIESFNEDLKEKSNELIRNKNVDRKLKAARPN